MASRLPGKFVLSLVLEIWANYKDCYELKARCHGNILRAGNSRWQVGYRVSLYRH